jgi:hypothetical protein
MFPNPKRPWIFLPDEEVMVSFPKHEDKIRVIQQTTGVLKDMPGDPDGFQPYRLVINLKLTHADQPGAPILKFDPPIELLVRFTEMTLSTPMGSRDWHTGMACGG